jgi:hypothetical protein
MGADKVDARGVYIQCLRTSGTLQAQIIAVVAEPVIKLRRLGLAAQKSSCRKPRDVNIGRNLGEWQFCLDCSYRGQVLATVHNEL